MPIEFTFDEELHAYRVSGHYVLGTSDVIALCGMCDYGAVPKAVLEHASHRGTQLHKAIELFEKDDLDMESISEEIMPYFLAYCQFRADHGLELIGNVEQRIVYEHSGCGMYVGCTIDLRAVIDGKPCIIDIKTSANQSGKAKAQTHLRWRLQLQSYAEATEQEMAELAMPPITGKAIVQVAKDGSYALHEFPADDSFLWDGCVRLAQAKIAAGFTVDRR